MELSSTLGVLQAELEKANANLKGVDESIKRFLGRDPNEPPLSVQYVFCYQFISSLPATFTHTQAASLPAYLRLIKQK